MRSRGNDGDGDGGRDQPIFDRGGSGLVGTKILQKLMVTHH
jgi:hypothetical protein